MARFREQLSTILDAVSPDGAEHPHIRQELLLNTVEVVSGVSAGAPVIVDGQAGLPGGAAIK